MAESIKQMPKTVDIGLVSTYESGVVQSKAYRALNTHFATCLKPHGLTTMQWFFLGMVYDAGERGASLSELAVKLGTTLPTLAEAASLLESKGWIVKTKHNIDGRARLLKIAPGRGSLCQAIEQDLRHQLRKSIYSKLTRAELTAYINALYKLAAL